MGFNFRCRHGARANQITNLSLLPSLWVFVVFNQITINGCLEKVKVINITTRALFMHRAKFDQRARGAN